MVCLSQHDVEPLRQRLSVIARQEFAMTQAVPRIEALNERAGYPSAPLDQGYCLWHKVDGRSAREYHGRKGFISAIPLARRRKRAYKAFGQGQKCLGMSNLLASLIGRHSMRWTVITAMPQILGCKQKAMKFGWNFPGAGKMPTESGDHCRMFGKASPSPSRKACAA
jgi:hypothetical protein